MLEKFLIREIMIPVIIILVSIVVYLIIKSVLNKVFKFKTKGIDAKRQNTIRLLFNNIVKVFVFVIAGIMILEVYGIDSKTILASLGVFTAVIALSLQDMLKDVIAGVSMILEGNVRMGDTITIGAFQGEVISMSLKSTRVKSFNGEVKIFANRNIIDVVNHTLGNSLAIIDVAVNPDSDVELVEETLANLCKKIEGTIPEIEGNLRLEGIIETTARGLIFRLSVFTKPMKQFKVQRLVLREAIVELANKNITVK
jgi:Small-conductance mechanosensitive channel